MVWPTPFDIKLNEFDAMELPGQQIDAAFAYHALDHVLNLDIKAEPGCLRLTSIMASVGKATSNAEIMEKMMEAGMNIALLNLCFGTKDEHLETIKLLKKAAKSYSVKMGRHYPLCIAARLTGRKIRTGTIADTYGDSCELKIGEVVRLTTDETYKDRCCMYTVYVDFPGFNEQVSVGDMICIDNDMILLKVQLVTISAVTCKVERGGILGSYKDVFVPNVEFDMPNYSDRDKMYIDMAIHQQLDILIASFVHDERALLELKNLLGEKGKKIAVMADIQTMLAFLRFDQILENSDAVIVTRQELGSEITPKKIVLAQKNLIARANKANVPVFVNAQLLSSMRTVKLPLRAELMDIGNCVLDGADGLVLSSETAVGIYPVEAVACMASTCKEAEACVWTKQFFLDIVDHTYFPCDQASSLAMAAVLAAQRLMAAGIVVLTTNLRSAYLVAKFRPRCPILAVTRYMPIAKQLHMWRGVIPLLYEETPDPEWQTDIEKRVFFATKWATQQGFMRIGDPIVILSGWRHGSTNTCSLRIHFVES